MPSCAAKVNARYRASNSEPCNLPLQSRFVASKTTRLWRAEWGENMTTKPNRLLNILRRHGVDDPHAFLEREGDKAAIVASPDPDVMARGNVQMMVERMTSREETDRGLAKLKLL